MPVHYHSRPNRELARHFEGPGWGLKRLVTDSHHFRGFTGRGGEGVLVLVAKCRVGLGKISQQKYPYSCKNYFLNAYRVPRTSVIPGEASLNKIQESLHSLCLLGDQLLGV